MKKDERIRKEICVYLNKYSFASDAIRMIVVFWKQFNFLPPCLTHLHVVHLKTTKLLARFFESLTN